MKIAVRIILALAICAMGYLCVTSITTPIKFENEQQAREKEVIKHLIDIRKIEVEFQKQNGVYCPSAEGLVEFALNGKTAVVLKEGTLTDEQLKNGLTEEKALKIIKRGKISEIEKNGLVGFRRDTTYVPVRELLFENKYSDEDIRDIVVIPFSNGQIFQIDTASVTNALTGITLPLFQASADFETYLGDLDKQQYINLRDKEEKLDRFCGLKVGSLEESNNNSGNWE